MLDTTAKLKNFILWCQKNKVKSFKNNEIQFELSEVAFLPEVKDFKEIKLTDNGTLSDMDNLTDEERDELMFWSSTNSSLR